MSATQCIEIHNISTKLSTPIEELLEKTAFPPSLESAITLVIADSYLDKRLESFNQESLHARRPYLLVKPSGMHWCIGPLVNPMYTTCWMCLARRLGGLGIDDRMALFASRVRRQFQPLVRRPTLHIDVLWQFVVDEIGLFLKGCPKTQNTLKVIDSRTGSISWHGVSMPSYCPDCTLFPPQPPNKRCDTLIR